MWRFSFLLLAACAIEMDRESVEPRAEVLSDCVVSASLGAPAAVELDGGSLWLWESASAFVARGTDPCQGVTAGPALVPLLPEELAENESRADGRRTAVLPRGGFFAGGTIHVYYDLALLGPGFFDVETLGTGVCTTTDPATPCARDGALLFDGDRGWPVHGVAADDGFAYLLGCHHAAAFEDLCGAARVPIDRAADPAAYEYYSWVQGWIRDPRQFTVAFENAGAITPSFDAASGRYRVVTTDVFSSTISLRTSETPWDGWSSPRALFTAEPPDDWFVVGGVEHAALASEGGRVLAVTYANPALHFARVRLP